MIEALIKRVSVTYKCYEVFYYYDHYFANANGHIFKVFFIKKLNLLNKPTKQSMSW
jgi:hypothetical protein